MMNLAKAVLQLKNEREQARRKLEQLDSALSALGGSRRIQRESWACSDTGHETESYVSGGAQTNCCGPARALGEVESSQAKQIRKEDDGG